VHLLILPEEVLLHLAIFWLPEMEFCSDLPGVGAADVVLWLKLRFAFLIVLFTFHQFAFQ